jgi:transketolase
MNTDSLKDKARQARIKVLEMVYKAQSSHLGSNFSCIDILTVIFDKADLSKDKVIVSKGWVAASVYYFLAQKGVIPEADLERFCGPDEEQYIGLLEPTVPGVHFAGGSMGYGLPAAVGFALAKKIRGEEGTIYCLLSDGEVQIGTFWESMLLAYQHHLDNLVVIVDNNGLQAMGPTDDILKIRIPFHPNPVDGHDFEKLSEAIREREFGEPTMIDAITTKGKGVRFMENNNLYHYKAPNQAEYEEALGELQNG